MMKQEMLCTCDICGTSEKAQRVSGQYNETSYVPPKGWISSAINRDVHLCPKCVAVFEKRAVEHG